MGEGQGVRERIAAGMVAAWRTRVSAFPGHEILEDDGVVLAWSGLPDPTLSVALIEREPDAPRVALETAERAFLRRGGTLGVDVERGRHPSVEGAFMEMGLGIEVSRPAMAIAVADLAEPRRVDGLGLRAARSGDDPRGMAVVETASFGTAPDVAARMFDPALSPRPNARSYVGELGGRVVAMAHVYAHEGSLGVFGVGVTPGLRRRGIGEAITAFAIVDAAASFGSDLAWLHASELGHPVYERMGFEAVAEWDVWARPPASGATP